MKTEIKNRQNLSPILVIPLIYALVIKLYNQCEYYGIQRFYGYYNVFSQEKIDEEKLEE